MTAAACSPEHTCVETANAPAELCDLHHAEFRAWQAYHGRTPDEPARTPAREWVVELPMTRPLSLNGRQDWRAKARDVARVRKAAAKAVADAAVPRMLYVEVELHYAPRDRRRRDADNLVATVKPVHDGLVDAGVIPDDTPVYLLPRFPVIDEPTRAAAGRIYVIVREATRP